MRRVLIGVDGRALRGGRGIARATTRLLDALGGTVRVEVPSRAGALLPRFAGCEVAWLPAPRPVRLARGVPYVLTLHDLSWVLRPQDFTRYERAWHRVARPERLAARAFAVCCDSAWTRDLALEHWDLDPARLHVVPLGVDPARAADPRPPLDGRPYVLFVGADEPRKGVDVLRAAMRDVDAELVCVGPGFDHVSDDRLHTFYAHARCVALPSWVEGYGLPPLEALQHGVPSVVSDLPVFHETLGDGALFVTPGDVGGLAAALRRLVADGELRETLVAAAPPRPLWAHAAEQLRGLLADAAAGAEGPR